MAQSKINISVIIPSYKCSKSILELYTRLVTTLDKIVQNFEIIFVNDASPENDWEIISKIVQNDSRVIGLNFSRNFGQHNAIIAGLESSKGEWCVVMDGDLQDKPEEIENLYKKALEGYQIVRAQRATRKDNFIKKMSSTIFYKVLSHLTKTKQDATVANFGIYSRNAINAVISMGDKVKYFPAMIQWVGFKSTAITVEHLERIHGQTSYNLYRLFKLAFNVMITFSDRPLKLVVKLGAWMSLISTLVAIIYFILALSGQITVKGWSSLIISIWFLGGINISIIGMVGLYVGKIFDAVKDRPLYIIKEKI